MFFKIYILTNVVCCVIVLAKESYMQRRTVIDRGVVVMETDINLFKQYFDLKILVI